MKDESLEPEAGVEVEGASDTLPPLGCPKALITGLSNAGWRQLFNIEQRQSSALFALHQPESLPVALSAQPRQR